MQSTTDLSKNKIYRVFDMLDVDQSGFIDFDEFYVLVCILLAVRVSVEGEELEGREEEEGEGRDGGRGRGR